MGKWLATGVEGVERLGHKMVVIIIYSVWLRLRYLLNSTPPEQSVPHQTSKWQSGRFMPVKGERGLFLEKL